MKRPTIGRTRPSSRHAFRSMTNRLFAVVKAIRKLTLPTDPMSFVMYAILAEACELGLLAFAAMLTVEAVLPGMITLRINLAPVFLVLLLLILATAALGKSLGISFPFAPDKRSPLTWIGISWLAFLLTLSSIRFPFWSVPLIVGGTFVVAHLFWKILFRNEPRT
ncbi:MAG: hypothetical protein HGB18_01695 [Candidatus Moranbacteria bacterium]|nr:hypothetical protein [Candidatus Moranbacteria bacterium]